MHRGLIPKTLNRYRQIIQMNHNSVEKLLPLRAKFVRILDNPGIESLLMEAASLLPSVQKYTNLEGPVDCLRSLESKLIETFSRKMLPQFGALLVVDLAIKRINQLVEMRLPSALACEVAASFERLVQFLDSPPSDYWIGSDYFLKDLRVFGGFSIPCGAQDVDLLSAFNRRGALKAWFLELDFLLGCRVLKLGGPRWLRIHTDPRFTSQFNETGWEACYLRIAELLRMYPTAKGMVGTSWFYDPQLITVSPRLGYLQTTPMNGGAFLVRNGPGAIHTERATSTSPSRRALFESGEYLPICYTIVWEREQILNWAEHRPNV